MFVVLFKRLRQGDCKFEITLRYVSRACLSKTHTYINTSQAHIHTYTHIYTQTYIHTHIQMHIHTNTHTHINTYIHTHKCTY